MNSTQVAVIGQGSVAAAASWILQSTGEHFYSLGRRGLSSWAYEFDVFGSAQKVSSVPPPEDLTALSAVGVVLVCVKAYDLRSACDHLSLFRQPVTVLPFVNGYVDDILDAMRERFPAHTIRQAVATVGVTRTPAGFSLRSRGGRYQFGGLGEDPGKATASEERLCSLHPSHDFSPTFEWRNDVQSIARRKWLFNTVINTITAARRLPANGDVLSDLPTLAAVFSEAWDLCACLWGDFPGTKADVYASMLKLIEDTSSNENSMAADVRLGRKTENEFLAGLSAKFPGNFPLLEKMSADLSGQ